MGFSVYKPILSVKAARRFDLGALFMRLYLFVGCVGVVAMLTLLGYSAVLAGTISSVMALTQFILAPQIGRIIDRRGQSKTVIITAAILLAGTAIMLANLSLSGPFWLNYLAAVLMGINASPQALTRTRWTYLIQSGRCPDAQGIDIKTVFSYEGVIDDIAFMIGPAAAVALSSTFFPEAGFLFGGIIYIAGVTLFLSAKDTEPVVGWTDTSPDDPSDDSGKTTGNPSAPTDSHPTRSPTQLAEQARLLTSDRNLLFLSSPLRAFFGQAFLMGLFYGVLDATVIVFTQDLGHPNYATIALFAESFISVFAGLYFGTLKLRSSLSKQLLAVSLLIGIGYGLFVIVCNAPTMFIVYLVAAPTYAPFIITLNMVTERCMPSQRLTEALTWVSAGSSLGLAVGPTFGGFVIDTYGSIAGYQTVGAICGALIILALACQPIFRKHLD